MSIGLVNGLQNSDGGSVINTPWIDFSEQSTIVGWGSFTTKNIRYKIVGKIVFVMFSYACASVQDNLANTGAVVVPMFVTTIVSVSGPSG